MKMEQGIYNISNKEYHKSEGISRSDISLIKKSPLLYWHKKNSLDLKNPSKEMILGNLVHTLVLEDFLLDKRFLVIPKMDLRTKDGRKSHEHFTSIANNVEHIIDEELFNLGKDIASSIKSHKKVMWLISDCEIEQSIYWIDEDTGITCKARPDIWNKEINVLCDLKTSSDCSSEGLRYSIKKYNYHIQAAMQIDAIFKATGISIETFIFIVSCTEKPHKPRIYELDNESIEQGRLEYKSALKVYKRCLESGSWDMDREIITMIGLNEYDKRHNPFNSLMEIHQCQN